MLNHKIYFIIILFVSLCYQMVFAQMVSSDEIRQSRDRSKMPPKIIPSASNLLPSMPVQKVLLPFFENFESGINGWTIDGQFNLIQNPQNYAVLNPDINPTLVTLPDNGNLPAAFSGSNMCWFGQTATGTFIGTGWETIFQTANNGGESVEPDSGSLISPLIDLTGISHAQLNFKTWWEIEGVDVNAYDLMQIEISTDNGVNFEPIGRGLLNPLNDVNGESWKPYSSGGLGSVGVWLNQLFDLTPWVGQMVYLRYRFDTVDQLYNGFRGWFIDDVSITSDPLPAPNIISIDPAAAYPGEIVKINGQNFINGAEVTVGDSVLSAIISSNLAQIETPSLAPGLYDVTITNPDGQFDTVLNGLTITNTFPPQIGSIQPDSAKFGTSVSVMVFGSDFEVASQVDIGGILLLNQTFVDFYTITGDSPNSLPVGYYNVKVTNSDGQNDQLVLGFSVYNTTGIGADGADIKPTKFSLLQNYPNPFNPLTKLSYSIIQSGLVTLKVYNVLGTEIEILVNEEKAVGTYELNWNADNLPSGVYFYKLQAGNFVETKKMILLK